MSNLIKFLGFLLILKSVTSSSVNITSSNSPSTAKIIPVSTTKGPINKSHPEIDEYIGPILVCKNKTDDGLNICLNRILNDLRPRLAAGIPEIGLQPLDPLHLESLDFKQGAGGVVVKAHFTNVTIRHLADFDSAVFKIKSKERILSFDLSAPRVHISGTYNLGGNILFFPIGGTGPYFFDVTGVVVPGTIYLKIVESKNGTKTVQVDRMNLDLSIKTIKINLDNLFNGNALLGPVINNVLNENSQELFGEIKPNLVIQIADIVKSITNAIIANMPFLVEFLEGA